MPGVKAPILREAALSEGGCWRFFEHDDTTTRRRKNGVCVVSLWFHSILIFFLFQHSDLFEISVFGFFVTI